MTEKCEPFEFVQNACTPGVTLIYVQKPLLDPTPKTAYLQRTCVSGEPVFNITTDLAGLVDMPGYDVSDRVKIMQSVERGSTTLDPVHTLTTQAPGTVFDVRVIEPLDREFINMCDPTNNHKVTLQYDVATVPPTLLSAWNLSTNAAYVGVVANLVECVSEKLDYGSPMAYCSGGQNYTRTDVFNALTQALVGSVWQDSAGTVVAQPPSPTIGACKVIGLAFNVNSIDCFGQPVVVPGTEGQLVETVPHPTAVQPTKDCNSNAQLAAVAAVAASVAPLAFGGRQSILQGWVLPFGGSVKVPAFIPVLYSSDNNPNNILGTIYYDQGGNLTSIGGFSLLNALGVFGVDWGLGPVPAVAPTPVVNTPGSFNVTGVAVTAMPVASVKSMTLLSTTGAVDYSTDGGATYTTIASGTRTWTAQPGASLNVSNMQFRGTLAASKYDVIFEV